MRILLIIMMVAFAAAGIFMLAVSLRELLRKFASHHRFERAEGIVIDIQRKTMRSTGRNHRKPTIINLPVIQFTTRSGQVVTFTSETGDSGDASRYDVDMLLPIRYDPEGKFKPMLDSWSGIWLPNAMAVLSGFVFLFGALLIAWAFGDRLFGQ